MSLLLCLLIAGCSEREELSESNAVYYWRTDFRLDSTEWAFLQCNHINKVYCRYFDVVINEEGAEPRPNATISFSSTLPDSIELIPTIYITEDCMHQKHQGLAEKIVKRIRQMNETNDIKPVSEIQIDCDYTSKSKKVYYQFLEEVPGRSETSLGTDALDNHPPAPALHGGTACGLWCADDLQHR